jgi:hypothetical protein
MTAAPLNLRVIETTGTRQSGRKQRPLIPSATDSTAAEPTQRALDQTV